MNNFEFRTVFINDITEKCAKFYIFCDFCIFYLSYGYQSVSNRLRAPKNINDIF